MAQDENGTTAFLDSLEPALAYRAEEAAVQAGAGTSIQELQAMHRGARQWFPELGDPRPSPIAVELRPCEAHDDGSTTRSTLPTPGDA
jgi:hypothetical protein